jgi:hypothetical protein
MKTHPIHCYTADPPAFEMRNAQLADFDGVPGYVYLARDGDKFKIGKSVSPGTLNNSRRTANPSITLLREWVVFDMKGAEDYLHRQFKPRLVPGTNEWFLLSPEELEVLTALDDWALQQFIHAPCSIEEFKSRPCWNRLQGGTYMWLFIFNPYIVLEFCTRGSRISRDGIRDLYLSDPITFLATCRLMVAFKTPKGVIFSFFEHLEHRDGGGRKLLAPPKGTYADQEATNP